MTDFSLWVAQELERRGWSRSEAARRGELSSSTIDKVIGGFAKPGPRFCHGLARAFGMSPEEVFRLAGLLPVQPLPIIRERRAIYQVIEDPDGARLLELYRQLDTDDRLRLLDLAERLAGQEPRSIGGKDAQSRTLDMGNDSNSDYSRGMD